MGSQFAEHSLLIDLDGVKYQGGPLTPGALQTTAWLPRRRIPHLFVSEDAATDFARFERIHAVFSDAVDAGR